MYQQKWNGQWKLRGRIWSLLPFPRFRSFHCDQWKLHLYPKSRVSLCLLGYKCSHLHDPKMFKWCLQCQVWSVLYIFKPIIHFACQAWFSDLQYWWTTRWKRRRGKSSLPRQFRSIWQFRNQFTCNLWPQYWRAYLCGNGSCKFRRGIFAIFMGSRCIYN